MTDRPQNDRLKNTLRKGWTTGACATAAATAAYQALLTGGFPDPVTITLPQGQTPSFSLAHKELGADHATASVIKDAGDDPDVTHGAEIAVTVSRGEAGSGIVFRAGKGVGTVTKPGLALSVGEPAINPAPRAMMTAELTALAAAHQVAPDVVLTIAIAGGEALAEKTLNHRLGIVGGLSVLGTTGIVQPYSCSAWIHSIHRGIDVARATGLSHIAAATGRTSEAAVRRLTGLPEDAMVEMGDFAGGVLKYLRDHPVGRLTLAGGFAKMAKLSQGELYLHSSASEVDVAALAAMMDQLGAGNAAVADAVGANTAAQVLAAARAQNLPLGNLVAARAREVALATLAGGTRVDVAVFDRAGTLVGRAGNGEDDEDDGDNNA
ncbi:MAG: cobalt-precorrin-5B (C(1))-methyltransferase [Rhodospirillales bacterium]|nr:cobalt-precorrin-5B (C(1))-methyltransferase [Rhodospirillales bacterium]